MSPRDPLGSRPQMPDLMHLTISESTLLVPPALLDHGAVGAGPGFIQGGCPSGSASYPALPNVGPFSLCAAGSFGPPSAPAGLQDFSLLPAPAELDPADTMEDLQNLVDPQNQQPVKYDLLNSVPRESAPGFLLRGPPGSPFVSRSSVQAVLLL